MDRIELTTPPCTVRLVVNTRARRFTLRLETGSDQPVLTVPPRVGRGDIMDFLDRHRGWLGRALDRQPPLVTVGDGTSLPYQGTSIDIVVTPGPRRAPVLRDGQLVLGGAGSEGARIAAWLKLRARDALLPAARTYARKLGRRISAISLRDTRSRWGSCSTTGRLSFSWRLIMAPPEVLDYVAAHEAAHLVEMNHSARYWAVVAGLMPDYAERRSWLKREGRTLHAYRFT